MLHIKRKTWYVLNAQLSELVAGSLTVLSTVQIILSSSASFAATSLNGSVGETHISVNRATKDKMKETTYPGRKEVICQSAKVLTSVR